MTSNFFWPARAISFLTSSELFEFDEKMNTITLASRIARTIHS